MNISAKTNTDQLKKDFEDFLKQKYAQPDPEQDSLGTKAGPHGVPASDEINFDLKPEELEAYLLQYVEQQEESIEILATKIATHYNRMKLEDTLTEEQKLVGNIKSNILMIGPTGVGKTYMIKLIAKKIGVPFVKGDATKFSETGYVGGDVEDLIRELVREADGDIKRAEYGIVYLDEIDKIASSANYRGIDVSRTGVQRNLLKLMEESEVDLRVPHDMAAQMEAAMEAQRTGKVDRKKVNTKNILFIMSGAFGGLEDIVRKRIFAKKIGFGSDIESSLSVSKTDLLRRANTEDLIEFGFESEFVGRLPVITVLNELDVRALFNILKNENSSVTLSKKRDFEAYGITVRFEPDALWQMAERAFSQKTGARGLVNVLENILIRFEKKLPSTQLKDFTVSRAVVDQPDAELARLLTRQSKKEFQEWFLTQHGIVVEFDENAEHILAGRALSGNRTFFHLAKELLKDYEYGIKLAGKNHFIVNEEVLNNPKLFLDELVKKTYSAKQQ